ncbi:MAG TPA: hypothetical protein VNK44_08530 [Candidatus Nitrosotenuis sp.]|nr:hypothetical protein [Candidatus Nitrosotenuis sp.]
MAIQILQYEFLGPIKLSEWGPPMEEVIYLVLSRRKETFEIVYAGECEKTDEADFFTKNDKFKCWIQNAGNEESLYLSIYPMWGSSQDDRKRILDKILQRYQPKCNVGPD